MYYQNPQFHSFAVIKFKKKKHFCDVFSLEWTNFDIVKIVKVFFETICRYPHGSFNR